MQASAFSVNQYDDIYDLYDMVMNKQNLSISEVEAVVSELGAETSRSSLTLYRSPGTSLIQAMFRGFVLSTAYRSSPLPRSPHLSSLEMSAYDAAVSWRHHPQ